jgi:hypothetical protein
MLAGFSDRGRHGEGDRSPPCRRPSLSPFLCRLRNCGDGHAVVVERVIEKSSAGKVFPTLTRTNYSEWLLVMHVNLQAAGFSDAIKYGTGDYREDRSALAALLRAGPEEMQAGLACKETTTDA